VVRGWEGRGVKNEAMEETVDAAWLQTELNRQEKIATSDTEEQMKESREKTDENTNESRSGSIKRSD
jgi:hypothetical protein